MHVTDELLGVADVRGPHLMDRGGVSTAMRCESNLLPGSNLVIEFSRSGLKQPLPLEQSMFLSGLIRLIEIIEHLENDPSNRCPDCARFPSSGPSCRYTSFQHIDTSISLD